MLALVAIMTAGFSLRIGVTQIGPVIDQIRSQTGMSATVAGAMGSIPFACMGTFAFIGVPLVLRLGARRLIALSLALLAAGTVARAVMPTGALVVAATFPVGIAIALVGLALPGVVKLHFPSRTGAAMGGYVAAMGVGASLAALTMVPLATALGGWRAAFAVSAVPTLLSIPTWLLLPKTQVPGASALETATESKLQGTPTLPARSVSPLAPPRRSLWLAAVFGLHAMCFSAVTSWIAALYHQNGWTEGAAGLTTALIPIVIIPGAIVIPALSDRGSRRVWLLGCAVAMAFGLFGLAFAPRAAPLLWIVTFAIGTGSLFALTLTLPQDLAQDERTRTHLTAWMLGLGYALSAAGPLLVGGLHDLTGAFVLPMALLAGVGCLEALVALAPALYHRPAVTSPAAT
jgi:CP family cyanate transporter-like MFS transporter